MYTVYIDLDGTLLDNNKKISEHTYECLSAFANQGNHIVLTTARSRRLQGLQELVKEITPYYVFHNGGEIICHGEMVYQNHFRAEETRQIGLFLTSHHIRAAVILDDGYYANYDALLVWGKIRNFCCASFSDAAFPSPRFLVIVDDVTQKKKLDELRDHIIVTYIENSSQAILSPLTASKGEAVRFLQKRYFTGGISVFIGNDHNDLSGFDACDMKAAVANAETGLLDRADLIIPSNQDEGVAYFLNSLMK